MSLTYQSAISGEIGQAMMMLACICAKSVTRTKTACVKCMDHRRELPLPQTGYTGSFRQNSFAIPSPTSRFSSS